MLREGSIRVAHAQTAQGMDRLNNAACEKIEKLLGGYTEQLVATVGADYGLEPDDVLTRLGGAPSLIRRFLKHIDELKHGAKCKWFTKRGDRCGKDCIHDSEYCTIHHARYIIHMQQVNEAKKAPERVNVTRKGLHNGQWKDAAAAP